MFARLLFGLVLGLIMYMPRPRAEGPPGSEPPSPEFPPGEDGGDITLPDWEPQPDDRVWPPGGHRMPPRHLPGPTPSVPPTAPPGFEGEWPPASERPDTPPDVPPTGPPGHVGPWNPGDRSSIRDLIDQLRDLLGIGGVSKRLYHLDAKAGAERVYTQGGGRDAAAAADPNSEV